MSISSDFLFFHRVVHLSSVTLMHPAETIGLRSHLSDTLVGSSDTVVDGVFDPWGKGEVWGVETPAKTCNSTKLSVW